eukprot:2809577-Alexandrium_andersonii.AAC.1
MPIEGPRCMPHRDARRVPGYAHDAATSGPRAEHMLPRQALGGSWTPIGWLSRGVWPRVRPP